MSSLPCIERSITRSWGSDCESDSESELTPMLAVMKTTEISDSFWDRTTTVSPSQIPENPKWGLSMDWNSKLKEKKAKKVTYDKKVKSKEIPKSDNGTIQCICKFCKGKFPFPEDKQIEYRKKKWDKPRTCATCMEERYQSRQKWNKKR